jgi:hypothetical protein
VVDFRKALYELRAKKVNALINNEGDYKMVDANKLSRLSAMWEKVVPIVPSFSNIPDGEYVGDIKEIKLGDSKAGRLQTVTTVEVVDGDFVGKTVKRFDGVEEETGMGYFKNLCEVIGLDLPNDMRLWQETMDAFVGDPNRVDLYDFTAKTTTGKEGQSYSNVYINGISEYTKGVEGEEQQAEEVAEEVQVEEVVEEVVEVVQEIVAPTRRVAAKPKVVAQPAKAIAQPVRKVVVATPAPKVVAQPVRKIVSLRK